MAEAGGLAGVPRFRHAAQNAVGIENWRRHQRFCLPAGVAKHDALVSGALVLVARRVDALRDIDRLRVQQNLDIGGFPMEPVLLVTDILDRLARGGLDQVERDRGRSANLARDNDLISRRQRLAGDPRLGIGGEEHIDHRVGNAIAYFIGVAFAYGFACE